MLLGEIFLLTFLKNLDLDLSGNGDFLYGHCQLFSQLCNRRDISQRVLVLKFGKLKFLYQFIRNKLFLVLESPMSLDVSYY